MQKKKRLARFHTSLPRTGTKAAAGYYESWRQINGFFNFIMSMVSHIEHTASTAHKVLLDTEADEAKRQNMVEEWKRRKSPVDDLRTHRQFFLEVILVRHIENYLGYLSALLHEIFIQRPETLRSSEKVDLSAVLRHSSIDSLVEELAEKKVDSLSYGSFLDLSDYFNDRFGLEIASATDAHLIVEAIETRNISVHNRCVKNQRYVQRVQGKPSDVGKKRMIYVEYLDELVPTLAESVQHLDKAARAKLRLKGIRFSQVKNSREDANKAIESDASSAGATHG